MNTIKRFFNPTPEQLRERQLAKLQEHLVFAELLHERAQADLQYLHTAIKRLQSCT